MHFLPILFTICAIANTVPHRLWRLLGDGEVVSMTKIASDHFLQTGRAFRIAIDEAAWRFKNLTEAQVEAIRQSMTIEGLNVVLSS